MSTDPIVIAIDKRIKEVTAELSRLKHLRRISKQSTVAESVDKDTVLDFFKKNPDSTVVKASGELGYSYDQVADAVHVLFRAHKLKRTSPKGQKRYVRYAIAEAKPKDKAAFKRSKKAKPVSKPLPPVSRTKPEHETKKHAKVEDSHIISYLNGIQKFQTADEIAEYFHVPKGQVQSCLRRMMIHGKIHSRERQTNARGRNPKEYAVKTVPLGRTNIKVTSLSESKHRPIPAYPERVHLPSERSPE